MLAQNNRGNTIMTRAFKALSAGVCAAALLMAGAPAALAIQPIPVVQAASQPEPTRGAPVSAGQGILGTLSEDDVPLTNDPEFEPVPTVVHSFAVRAGERYAIALNADDFDPYLTLVRRQDNQIITLREDDDSGGELNSLISFTATGDETLELWVSSFLGASFGDYELVVQSRGMVGPPSAPTRIAMGQSVSGTLSEDGPQDEDGRAFNGYQLRLASGERVQIDVESEDFDTYLQLGTMQGNLFVPLRENDDFGGSLNSRIVHQAERAGDYVIRVQAFAGRGEGSYRLSVQRGAEPARPQSLRIGDTVSGSINELSPDDDDIGLYQPFSIRVRAGQRLSFIMRSEDFDTYLYLGQVRGGQFEDLASDDDGLGEGLNSLITYTFERAGDYEVRASSFMGFGSGDFTLEVREERPEPAPTAIRLGQSVEGRLRDGGQTDARGRLYDTYRFSGSEGQRIEIIMRSGDFDTYLELSRAEGTFSVIASDDDGLGEGLDSRLLFTLPETGSYLIRARPFAATGSGAYSLELRDRGPEPRPGSMLIGEVVRGTLSDADEALSSGAYYDTYRFQAREGDKLRISMISNSFDAFLVLGRDSDSGGFTSIATDDDSLSDTHAVIDHTVTTSGTYVIRATSYGPRQTGPYVLIVDRQPTGD